MAPSAASLHQDSEEPGPNLPREIRSIVRYRGFVLIPQADLTWLIRPERSPMAVLPFRAPASSLTDVKALVDWRLEHRSS